MSAAIRVPVLQGSPEWLAARRELITASAIPVLLGLSPWRCEADLAAEMLGTADPQESSVRMRIGLALEPLIAAEYEQATGRRVRRIHGLWRHPTVTWAGASPDFAVVGERRLMEAKWTGSRSRFADGLPEDIEAQAAWQMFVSGYPVCDVAALVAGDEVRVFTVEADAGLQQHLVTIAADFRRRLAAGGPFTENAESLKRRYPRDNGAEMAADAEIAGWVRSLTAIRAQVREAKSAEEGLEAALKGRMGEIATVRGPGFHITWRRTKDREATDYRSLAESLLAPMPEPDRAAVVGAFTTVQEGFRPFRVVIEKEDAS